ncbi:MAG: hypothetical protein FJY17_02370 [Bacteroidetes bacterium]|nr:hypothetical protein [Bacteroidota bacterium]MBM3886859.1 hypothetical protein [Candidatus Dependentiae bacterium]
MKKLYFLFIALALSLTSMGQAINDVGKISLSVVMPENVEGLEISQLSKLETKISQLVSVSGLASSGYDNNFIIYPKFAIYESYVGEGGMQNISVVTADLSLFIKQVENNLLFSAISKPLKGSGSTKVLAISNAISKITINDIDFKTFIETGKFKIIAYYEAKCVDIIKKSDSYVKMQQYEQALGLLMSVPEEVSSCYNQIQDKAIEAYKAYQTQKCSELIQKANTSLAGNDYMGALNILSEIDPSATCFTEAQTIAKLAENKCNAEEKKRWDFQMKQYDDAISLERQRIEAIKEIAVSYYKSQRRIVNYNYIVK